MEAKTILLKPNSSLLDSDFSGYKLSLDKIATHSRKIKGVLQAAEPPGSYSYQQVRLYALHNHLWQDPWSPRRCYLFLQDGTISQIQLDQHSETVSSSLKMTSVLHLPTTDGSPPEVPAHPSLSMTSAHMVLVSDGCGKLHLVETGNRDAVDNWEIRFSDTVLEGRGFVLLHSLLDAAGDLHVLTGHVAEAASVPEWRGDGDKSTFLHLLTWLQYKKGETGWTLGRLRQAATASTIHYACLEVGSGALCVAADRTVRYIRDTARPVLQHSTVSTAGRTPAAGELAAERPAELAAEAAPLYVWSQTAEDVTVQLTVAEGASPQVVLESHALTLTVGGDPLLRGALPVTIRLDESTWTCDQGRVEVVLAKAETGRVWEELLVGDTRGRQEADSELAAAAAGTLATLTSLQGAGDDEMATYNVAELDTCDDFPEQSAALVRLDGETHAVTHQADLSSHQYILTVQLSAAEQPALCVRHDVDALLWQPRRTDNNWQCEHVGTLNAFGYVQASKTQRKFLTCAPDGTFAVISDTSRHLFIYHQPSAVDGDLRNRMTGQRVSQVSRQQVVSLEDCDPILGVAAASGCIYVLTTSHLHALPIR